MHQPELNKKELSEADIRTKYITPALQRAGWDILHQIREELSLTPGRITVRGNMTSRGKGKRPDYVLYYKPNMPLAVIEAKDNKHSVGAGMQQALFDAKLLDVPFVFSSNGDGFVFHDKTCSGPEMESTLSLDAFPSPEELWRRYNNWKWGEEGLTPEKEKIILQQYFDDGSEKKPRYYQVNAINAVIEAIARKRNRILLVMATGTGKTYTAFQIIWRLWKGGIKKRILFLADRNILVDQAVINDFKPFGGAMTKISTRAKSDERKATGNQRSIDTSREIYLSLYQAITGPEEDQKIYRELSPDFFDLIIIDECHRGSARDDSAWREILEHFSSATQIGMTATPKETEYISNISYFGDPVYFYSLKQGISDGFLAPYKVIRIGIDLDIDGYRPEKGQLDRYEQPVEYREYSVRDMESNIVLDGRTKLIARKVSQYLKEGNDPYQKSIIFCVDQEHAARMRQALVNENYELFVEDDRYVMRITSEDTEGQNHLDSFIDPESRYPVLVTTSQLLSTGVDVQTCRLIVLDREVGSMIEFKQIVGRGTRIHEDTDKFFFTLIDFRGASRHFADPEFDGEPVQIYEPEEGEPVAPPVDGEPHKEQEQEGEGELPPPPPPPQPRNKIYVDGIEAEIVYRRVRYMDASGNLITERLEDYTKKVIQGRYSSLDNFLKKWHATERKQAIIEELEEKGLPLDVIADELKLDLDPFDLICHIAFDAKPLSRRQRVEQVKERELFAKHGELARAVINALLDKYADYTDADALDLGDPNILRINPISELGTPVQLINSFGSKEKYNQAIQDLQSALYHEVA